MQGERVFIVGAGYVGEALAAQMIQQGGAVTALTRNPERARRLQSLGADVLQYNVFDTAWQDTVGDCGHVVFCLSSSGGDLTQYRQAYVDAQEIVLSWMGRRGELQSYTYTGSTAVYPQHDGGWVREGDARAESERGQILLQAESLAAQAVHAGARWQVLRLSGIYGPGRHYLLDRLRRGELTFPGQGDLWLNLIYIADVAGAIYRTWEVPQAPSGIFNLTDRSPCFKEELVQWLAQQVSAGMPQFDPAQEHSRSPMRRNASGHLPNRRVCGRKFRETFQWQHRYPGYETGYGAILERGAV